MRLFWILLSYLIVFTCYADTLQQSYEPLNLRHDDSERRTAPQLAPGSHLKLYIPSLPYLYVSHAINGALFRPANNERGWKYDLALSYKKISDTVYEFKLRQGVAFQDGTPFNADMVLLNMEYFKKKPFLYSKMHEVFDYVEKIDDFTIRFHLTQKYGVFLNDLVWVQFYTQAYLEKFGWNGKATCPNLAEPGPYGIGPYILTEGYIEGDRKTPKAELVANPNYWDSNYPKIEKITVYTEYDSVQAKNDVLYKENVLDITPIAFENKAETILSPYAKLLISPSTASYAIHINMRNGNPQLLKKEVRLALNQALNRKYLLYFVYEGEAQISLTLASPNFPGVQEASLSIKPYDEYTNSYEPEEQKRLKSILDGLRLKVLTQERFLFLWRGIEYQLGKVGVTLDLNVTNTETVIFQELLSTNARQNTVDWDLLIWGNDDWFFFHPWTAFFVYRTHNVWSTIFPDPIMDSYIEEMFKVAVGEPGYLSVVKNIMQRAHDNAYMLFVPTPNKVLAVNKEVIYTPYKMASVPLWEIELTTEHPSIRNGEYPERLKKPVAIVHKN
jgi:peptide/nickel transport system substrate-binding protein